MKKFMKWLLAILFALVLAVSAGLGAAAWWLSGDGPRQQLERLASEQLGVSVTISHLSLAVFPLPGVAAQDLLIGTQPPLKAQRIEIRPQWRQLLGLGGQPRQLVVSSLALDKLSLPQRGLDQLQRSLAKKEPGASQRSSDDAAVAFIGILAIPQELTLQSLTYLSESGEALTLSGRVRMSDARDVAEIDMQLGGGSVRGTLRLQALSPGKTSSAAGSNLMLRGELSTSDVDIAALPGLRTRLAGRLQATTTLDASAAQASNLSNLSSALQTHTQFSVSSAVLKGLDLAKAVRTLGIARGGETALEQLSGNLNTRGSGAAMQLSLVDLQAKSKLLSASGNVNVGPATSANAPRALSGKLTVDLTAGGAVGQAVDKVVGQLVGIPLEISGTTAAPIVAPTRGAMVGGAIGSVMAPVIGTGAGAKMGDKVGETLSNLKERLFGK